MLSILVGHSYFLRFDQKQVERAKPYPPLATLQVAATLRGSGHRVSLFDAMLADGVEEYERILRTTQPQLVLFYEDNFNFLSKMCLGKMRQACCGMIGTARRYGARVIAAGSDVTDEPEAYLHAGADAALIGEGLPALYELIRRIDSDPRMHCSRLVQGLSGVMTFTEGKMTTGRAHAPGATGRGPGLGKHGATHQGSAEPAALPNAGALSAHESAPRTAAPPAPSPDLPPAWDLLDIERYRAVWHRAHGHFSLNMAASRGCSFRCAWCAKPIWGNQYLQRSAQKVAEEMALLKRTYAPDHVWFADDIFGFRADWVTEFAQHAARLDGSIPFTIQTRADLISERMAEALRIAGCREAWIGAESGSQRVLDAMNKGTTVAEIHTARARLKSVSIRVGFFLQLGYLGEELPDILATRELLEATRPDDVGVSVSYPLPGTRFYELVKEQLHGKTHWQESDDLDMMFQGTYTSDFYRALRNLLHDEVSLEQPEIERRSSQYRRSRRTLDRRWMDLLSREHQFRSNTAGAVAAGATG